MDEAEQLLEAEQIPSEKQRDTRDILNEILGILRSQVFKGAYDWTYPAIRRYPSISQTFSDETGLSSDEEPSTFVSRLLEVLGTDNPSQVKRLLNISDQAARNYLAGRMPTPEFLITIAEQTPYLFIWLLPGRRKFATFSPDSDSLYQEIRESIRDMCLEIINEVRQETQRKIAVTPPEKVKS